MKQYLNLLDKILKEGVVKSDRTGTGTKSIFGHQMRFDLRDGFPVLTTKKLHLRSIIHELLWFISGDTNIKYLKDNGLTKLVAGTRIIIVPGFKFRLVDMLVTNFHQPESTLILLVSAFVGGNWRPIYDYALANGYRFLSYGDSSLLFRK